MDEVKINLTSPHPDKVQPRQKEKALEKACREFESIFTYQLLKSMRRTVEKCDLFHGGQGEEIYESLLDMELSKGMTGAGPNSLASLLYRQLAGTGVLGKDNDEASKGNGQDQSASAVQTRSERESRTVTPHPLPATPLQFQDRNSAKGGKG